MKDIKVYKMNDYEYWVSKWDVKATNEWYLKEHELEEQENPLEDIRECDLDTERMWWGSGENCEHITFREGINKENLDFKEPYCIACRR